MRWLFSPALRPLTLLAALASLVLNVTMIAPSMYMLLVFDRVFSSRSIETLAMLTLLAVISLVLMYLMDTTRAAVLAAAAVQAVAVVQAVAAVPVPPITALNTARKRMATRSSITRTPYTMSARGPVMCWSSKTFAMIIVLEIATMAPANRLSKRVQPMACPTR